MILKLKNPKKLLNRINISKKYLQLFCSVFLLFQPNNERRIVSYERNLKNALTPDYQWLFITIGRLQNGVKFLVDLRTDILVSNLK